MLTQGLKSTGKSSVALFKGGINLIGNSLAHFLLLVTDLIIINNMIINLDQTGVGVVRNVLQCSMFACFDWTDRTRTSQIQILLAE